MSDVPRSEGDAQPIIQAIWRRDVQGLSRLLKEGADPNTLDSETPALVWAINERQREFVRMLLDAGADANAGGPEPLERAAFLGEGSIVALLLERGADPNRADADGATALMSAAKSGQTDIVDTLLGAGAHVNARDRDGRTALCWVTIRGDFPETVSRLIKARADVNAQSTLNTPLTGAAFFGGRSTVKVLLNAGADKNRAEERTGLTPLMLAAWWGHLQIVTDLATAGVATNARDNHGTTALMYAARAGHLDVVRALIAQGAEVNAINEFDYTALRIADEKGDAEVAALLSRAGARPLA